MINGFIKNVAFHLQRMRGAYGAHVGRMWGAFGRALVKLSAAMCRAIEEDYRRFYNKKKKERKGRNKKE